MSETNTKQIICDRFIEKVISDFFGKPKVPAIIDLWLRNRGFDIQQKVDSFDMVMKEFMTDAGKIRAQEVKKFAMDYLPEEDFFLQDKYEELKQKMKEMIGAKK